MYVISINNRTADKDLRGRLSIRDDDLEDFLRRVSEGESDTVAVCTCNRCEIYGEGDAQQAVERLAEYSGVDVSEIREHCLTYVDKNAIRHLFSVCAGLDSMVIGEDEILGQVKNACRSAKSAGTYGNSFPQIFQAAFAAAKRVKTETLLSKTSVSVATLAAAYCHRFSQEKKQILMIGAGGDIGSSLRKDLLSYGDCEITATVHRNRFDERGIKTISYDRRYDGIAKYDIIISATKSPHFTITKPQFMEEAAPDGKKRLFIDLAVPADIDCAMAQLPGAELLTIDDFRKLAYKNNELKASAAESAAEILNECVGTLLKELYVKEALDRLGVLSDRYGDGFRKFFFDFKKEADEAEFRAFLDTVERL